MVNENIQRWVEKTYTKDPTAEANEQFIQRFSKYLISDCISTIYGDYLGLPIDKMNLVNERVEKYLEFYGQKKKDVHGNIIPY